MRKLSWFYYNIKYFALHPPLSRYPAAYASENGRPQRGLDRGLRPYGLCP